MHIDRNDLILPFQPRIKLMEVGQVEAKAKAKDRKGGDKLYDMLLRAGEVEGRDRINDEIGKKD